MLERMLCNMNPLLLETWNTASKDYPFVDTNSRIMKYFPHFHDEIEIMVIISGELSFTTTEYGVQTAQVGDICIFMPQQIHSFSSLSSSNHMYILKLHSRNSKEKINFNLLRFENSLLKNDDPFNAVLRNYIDILCTETQEKKIGYGFLANSISNLIISEILRSDHLIILDNNYEKKVASSAKLLSDVNEYISEHYTETIYLEDLAKYCHLSKYYFAHQFKVITNLTFYEYLIVYRLDIAKNLLSTTKLPISEIAMQSGFATVRSFNRVFKENFDCSPTQYRKASS